MVSVGVGVGMLETALYGGLVICWRSGLLWCLAKEIWQDSF
jgi:hypothetical protein